MNCHLSRRRTYILGHLLTQYYQVIDKDIKVKYLLLLRDKTNLTKEVCFKFMDTFEEMIEISKRWKLVGREFLDLAMKRLQTNTKNRALCVENGC